MTTVNDLLNRTRDLIQDVEGNRWKDAELIRWINDAMQEIVRVKPESNAEFRDKSLASGVTQSLPSDALNLIRVVSTGTQSSPGKVPTLVDINQMNRADPNWRYSVATTTVEHIMLDAQRDKFHVYPPNNGSGFLVLECGIFPTKVTDLFDQIVLDDDFAPTILNYVCYRALDKDADHMPERQRAAGFLKAFYDGLGVTMQTAGGGG